MSRRAIYFGLFFRPTNTRRRGCTNGGSNSPFPLEPRSSTLDPQMPPMLGFRCKRDKMQKTTFRQGVQRNLAFFCQCDQMSCKRGPSDARGNCTNPTGTVIAFPCPVKSPRKKQLKFVISRLHVAIITEKTRRMNRRVLPSPPEPVCVAGDPLPVALSDRSAPALHWSRSFSP